jgi:hypothetical protein
MSQNLPGEPGQPYGQQPPQPYGQPYPPQGPTPYGQPGGYSRQIPPGVNIASILLFIAGGFGVLGGLLLLAVGSIAAWVAVIGVVVLIVAAAEIYVGLQLRKLMPWARTATIVLAGIGALMNLISIISGGFTSVISLALDAYVIYLMYQPETVRAFPASTRPGGI